MVSEMGNRVAWCLFTVMDGEGGMGKEGWIGNGEERGERCCWEMGKVGDGDMQGNSARGLAVSVQGL